MEIRFTDLSFSIVISSENKQMDLTINEIISRVLSGEATSQEMQHLLEWYRESGENPKEFAHYEMLWNALEIIGRKQEFDSDKAYQKFSDYIEGTENRPKSLSIVGSISKVAAIVLLASGLAFLAGYFLRPQQKDSGSLCQVVTPKGSKAFVELPDGTKVWLNAESKLRYPEKFSKNERNVYLEGEGYFDVATDKQRPFIVRTSKINVRALGTAFNVKSYPGEDIIQTTLVNGLVEIEKQETGKDKPSAKSADNHITFLKPNQQATFFKSTSKIDVSSKTSVIASSAAAAAKVSATDKIVKKDSVILDNKVNTSLFTAWKDDKLMFDNEPFESLAVKLERQFNMKFHFLDNEIKSFRFTGHFDEISMEQFLEALQYASPFHYAINKSNIYISIKPIQIRDDETHR